MLTSNIRYLSSGVIRKEDLHDVLDGCARYRLANDGHCDINQFPGLDKRGGSGLEENVEGNDSGLGEQGSDVFANLP
jgi:hypothetical protein